jgi:hypothetical protein
MDPELRVFVALLYASSIYNDNQIMGFDRDELRKKARYRIVLVIEPAVG